MLRKTVLFLTLMVTASAANAQQLISRNLVNGRMVEIFSDYTWRYEDANTQSCIQISTNVKICDFEDEWQLYPTPMPANFFDFRHDELTAARITHEGIGANFGWTANIMTEAMLLSVAEFYGIDVQDITVYESGPATISGLPAYSLVYGLEAQGVWVIIHETVWVGKEDIIEVSMQNYDLEVTEQAKELNRSFISKIMIDDAE